MRFPWSRPAEMSREERVERELAEARRAREESTRLETGAATVAGNTRTIEKKENQGKFARAWRWIEKDLKKNSIAPKFDSKIRRVGRKVGFVLALGGAGYWVGFAKSGWPVREEAKGAWKKVFPGPYVVINTPEPTDKPLVFPESRPVPRPPLPKREDTAPSKPKVKSPRSTTMPIEEVEEVEDAEEVEEESIPPTRPQPLAPTLQSDPFLSRWHQQRTEPPPRPSPSAAPTERFVLPPVAPLPKILEPYGSTASSKGSSSVNESMKAPIPPIAPVIPESRKPVSTDRLVVYPLGNLKAHGKEYSFQLAPSVIRDSERGQLVAQALTLLNSIGDSSKKDDLITEFTTLLRKGNRVTGSELKDLNTRIDALATDGLPQE